MGLGDRGGSPFTFLGATARLPGQPQAAPCTTVKLEEPGCGQAQQPPLQLTGMSWVLPPHQAPPCSGSSL